MINNIFINFLYLNITSNSIFTKYFLNLKKNVTSIIYNNFNNL